MFGQTALAYVLMLLAKLGQQPDGNDILDCDNLVGLPHTKDRQALAHIKEKLISLGAQRPALHFFSSLPTNPPSPYLAFNPTWKLSTNRKAMCEVQKEEEEEKRKQQEAKDEEERFSKLLTKPAHHNHEPLRLIELDGETCANLWYTSNIYQTSN